MFGAPHPEVPSVVQTQETRFNILLSTWTKQMLSRLLQLSQASPSVWMH